MRRLLYAAGVLVVLAGLDLSILTDHTDRFFAWTVTPGLTAAFLGAGYLGAFILEFLAARERQWARARIAVPTVLVFTVLTLVVTIVHRDRFHFHSPHPVARLWTWAWLAIYVLVPLIMVVLLVGQRGAPGADPVRARPIPTWARVCKPSSPGHAIPSPHNGVLSIDHRETRKGRHCIATPKEDFVELIIEDASIGVSNSPIRDLDNEILGDACQH